MNKEEAIKALEDLKVFSDIVKYIRTHYVIGVECDKIRRGTIQRDIANTLGLTKNPKYWNTIKRVSSHLGLKEVMINGIGYYKNIREKEENEGLQS